MFGWKHEDGKKYKQKIIIPKWIGDDSEFIRYFIKGLFESDGSIYLDRNYKMVNFVSYNREVISYIDEQIVNLKFKASISKTKEKNGFKYTLRVSKNSNEFIKYFNLKKE